MKEHFRATGFTPRSRELIDKCNAIIERYQGRSLRMTLRQLYYQLVAANVIANSESSYKNLGDLVSNGRLAGEIDWGAIEDRVRVPRRSSEYRDPEHLAYSALHSYRLPRWDTQPNYVELWVEKDAIANVLSPIASDLHITLMVNRGYSSQSAMYEASKRFLRAAERGKRLRLFYLGDHDPSGEDMVRDVRDRLAMFGVEELKVVKIALTMEQIKKYSPPPNPAKVTDARAKAYIEKFGEYSWEVDALPPEVLDDIVRAELKKAVDHAAMRRIKEQEERDMELIRSAMGDLMNRRGA
jgi:hypothetical protein